MTLGGARVAQGADQAEPMDVVIRGGRIAHFETPGTSSPDIDLSGYLLLPGLINAHDHLEFNLFPRLGRGPYKNATEWARDVYTPELSPVKEQLSIPKSVRMHWGGLKNLLTGVTTVAHHNPYDAEVFDCGFPVRVMKHFAWAHSLHYTPDLAKKFRGTPSHLPFVIHAAEGTDENAFTEIERLDDMGVLTSRTVLIHAIALSASAINLIELRRCSIVWCQSSNLFTCGRSISSATLRSEIPIAIGTDSALTADGDLLDEICAIRRTGLVANERIYEMLTSRAAAVLRLTDGEGAIREGGVADLIAVRDSGQTPSAALAALPPELVIVGGRIAMISGSLRDQYRDAHLHRIAVEGRGECFVDADVPRLTEHTTRALGNEFRIAEKRLCR